MRKMMLMLGCVLAISLAAGEGRAGAVGHDKFCTSYADGSGVCYGSMAEVRNTGLASDYMMISAWTDSGSASSWYGYFQASLGNTYYLCSVDSTSPAGVRSVFQTGLTYNRGYLYVYWNAQGRCVFMGLAQGSEF
jgi:hypothetical protein